MFSSANTRKSSPFLHNLIALFSVQAVNYIIPLLTIPYLTRVLKPEGWGQVAFVQSLGLMLITIMEYGFSLSAARTCLRGAMISFSKLRLVRVTSVTSVGWLCLHAKVVRAMSE